MADEQTDDTQQQRYPEVGWVVGTGMPASLLLDEFGSQVWAAFGHPPYHVGSSLTSKTWRDVDVRLILPDDEYAAWGFGDDAARPSHNEKWVSFVLAYSALGKAITGLPIDFQIQQQTYANEHYKGPRGALGHIPLRIKRYDRREVMAREVVYTVAENGQYGPYVFTENVMRCGHCGAKSPRIGSITQQAIADIKHKEYCAVLKAREVVNGKA